MLIKRVMAETGFKDRTKKAAMLYQKNMKVPFTVEVNGLQVTVQPQQLQGKITCHVDMDTEQQVGYDDAAKIERMFQFLASANQLYPGLVGPKEIHNLVTRYVKALGFNLTKEYVVELQAFVQHIAQQMQGNQQAQQAQMQMANAQMQADLQVKSAESNAKTMAAQADMMDAATKLKALGVDIDIAQLQEQTKIIIKQMDVDQKNREAALDYQMNAINNRMNLVKDIYANRSKVAA